MSAQQPSLYTGPNTMPLMYQPSSLPPGGVPVAAGTCQTTAEVLEGHLERSNHGQNKAVFLCYFKEGMPPRCVTCGETIGAHPRAAAGSSSAAQTAPGAFGEPIQQPRAFTDPVLHPECSFCATFSQVNEPRYKMTIQGSNDPEPLLMKPIQFNDDEVMRQSYGGTSIIACDECYTIFPTRSYPPQTAKNKHHPLPPATDEEKQKIADFYTKFPTLQCYACKYCSRKVCSDCIQNDLHRTQSSRFDSSEKEWKTSLFGCCGSPLHTCNALLCYYFCLHGSSVNGYKPAFSPTETLQRVDSVGQDLCLHIGCFPIFTVLAPAFSLVMDIMCCYSVFLVSQTQVEFQRRYGLPAQGCPVMCFCRYCAFIRLIREAEERGYPQHTCCTQSSAVTEMVKMHPPLNPRAKCKNGSEHNGSGSAPDLFASAPAQASMF